MKSIKSKYIIGIDEAGRGPLAGPVAVGVVMVRREFDMNFFKGIRDSKKISEKVREDWFEKIKAKKNKGDLDYKVSLSGPGMIDERGIAVAIKKAMCSCLARLNVRANEACVLLDGSLKAPAQFKKQKTIIRGDQTEPLISAGAIMAKVTRDRHMKRLAKKYPHYDFHIHKGYGTASHLKKIKKFGYSPIHRRSFLRILRSL